VRLVGPLSEAKSTALLLSMCSSKGVVGRGSRRDPDGSKLAHEGECAINGPVV
jgi:hypothetical protein